MGPFFSIITPVYNCRNYVRKCIESVLKQTYTSWELILVDDGSTDSSGEICDGFLGDSRIKVIHQKNQGALHSRIKGIAVAKGQYELGLDADDFLDENCLEILKRAIDISGSDLIFFGYRCVGRQRSDVICSLLPNREYTQKEILREVIRNTNHSLWNKAIKIDVVRKAKYFIPKQKLSINLDYAQIIPILCNISTGYVIDEVLYNYRIYGKSTSHACKVQHIYDTDLVTRGVIHSLTEAEIIDADLLDDIYFAYLKMIGFRIMDLFRDKKITKEDCKKIHRSKVYRNSKRVECSERFDKREFKALKLFRHRQYWAMWLMTKSF